MHVFSYALAVIIGLVFWGLALALSGGVAPLGRVGQIEGLIFLTPIALFALPLAVLAFVREQVLASVWLFAVAPLLGFVNFSASVAAAVRNAGPNTPVGNNASTFALFWCVMLVIVLAVLAIGHFAKPTQQA